MTNLLLSFICTYYFAAIVQTVFHKFYGHRNRINTIYSTHALGHHAKYKSPNLLTDKWIDSEQHVVWYYAIPVIPVFLLISYLFSFYVVAGFLAGLIFSIWWHVYIHRQYHIKGSYLERFEWFMKKRQFHFEHHKFVRSNYAIVECWIDDLMNTRYKSTN